MRVSFPYFSYSTCGICNLSNVKIKLFDANVLLVRLLKTPENSDFRNFSVCIDVFGIFWYVEVEHWREMSEFVSTQPTVSVQFHG